MSQDTNVQNLIINKLTKAQYDGITTPSSTELYMTTDEVLQINNLFDFKWSDHLLDDISWLRADTFSWQSGDTYTSAYNHLVQDIQVIISETETIGSYTVTFYRATDGHKICLADQETTIANIYSETGIAWYYILDTTNTQFKLPRTKYGFEGLRTNVGDKIDESLPNIKGNAPQATCWGGAGATQTGAFQGSSSNYQGTIAGGGSAVAYLNSPRFDASGSSSTYQDNAPVQERATQMYLYFYVGDYTQSAIEQTAGLNSELFNGKLDIPTGGSQSSVGLLVESYVNGTSWYRVYSDGWCEQGGGFTTSASWVQTTITFLKSYKDTNYTVSIIESANSFGGDAPTIQSKSTSSMVVWMYNATGASTWQACGYIS